MLTPVAHLLQVRLRLPVSSDLLAGTVPLARLSSLLLLLWLLLVWVGTTGRAGRVRRVAATGALWAVVSALTLVALDVSTRVVVQECLATLLQAGVALAVYRWRIGDDILAPHRPADVLSLLGAVALGSLVSAPLAPVGGPGFTAESVLLDYAAWVLLGTTYCFVGAACLLLLVQRRPGAEALPTRLTHVVVLTVVTGLAIALELGFDQLSISWLVLLPAVGAGLLMGPWSAAAFGLAATIGVLVLQAVRSVREDWVFGVNLLLVDAMMVAFVLVAMLLSLVRDQSAHLAGEVVRRRQEALDQAGVLETLIESVDEALVLLDAEGRVQLHNRAAVTLLGEERLLSEPRKWLRTGGSLPFRFSYTFHRDSTDDTARILAVQLASVQYAGASGIAAIARDVTHEHRRIEELASFASVAAHDLKSPLAAVQGWLVVAEDAVGTDHVRARHAVRRGRSAAQRMVSEIDDWLTYTVAREGELTPERVALEPMLHEVAASHADAEFHFEVEHVVLADKVLLRHLLSNLLGNAVKYTLPGQQAQVRLVSSHDGSGWVRLRVIDAGIGIPAGEERAVFEPFRRASTVTSTHEGSGLGLALCRRIVRRHGGVISAQRNDPPPGTTITLTLPADRPLRTDD